MDRIGHSIPAACFLRWTFSKPLWACAMKIEDVSGKNIYITGGSSGIGLSAAIKFAAGGANLLILARRAETLKSALAQIEASRMSADQRIDSRQLDVSDHEAVSSVLGRAATEFGVPDVLINSAGVSKPTYFEDLDYESFDQIIKINLYGTRNTVFTLAPLMKEKGGMIVNVSSIAGFIGVFGFTGYSASKFGVIGFSEALRSELKPFNVTVSVLCPPDTDTPMLHQENKIKPVETAAISETANIMSADAVADALVRGIKKDAFMIIPGFDGKMTFLGKRFLPGIIESVIDRTIKKCRK